MKNPLYAKLKIKKKKWAYSAFVITFMRGKDRQILKLWLRIIISRGMKKT